MSKLLREIMGIGQTLKDKRIVFSSKWAERKKFKDPKRVAIYKNVELTDSQKREIDELFVKNYGKKIPYTWHRHYTAFTGNFDPKYIPELIFIPEFERFMNMNKNYNKVLADKNIISVFAKNAGITVPETFIACIKGVYRDKNDVCIKKEDAIKAVWNIGEAFIKPTVDSSSGQGCAVVNFVDGKDTISGKSVEELFEAMGRDFLLSERLKCHESISTLYPNSVNTFRIMTYRWNEELLYVPSIMRIGQGGAVVDNAHQGGIFIAIDDDGALHKKAITEFKKEFFCHPDTNVVFDGYKIELFPKVLAAAKRMHDAIPQIGMVSWDFTINEAGGPVLIEANLSYGSVWLFEMAHGVGAFGDKTEEVLRWIRFMKKTKLRDRAKFAFGKMPENECK